MRSQNICRWTGRLITVLLAGLGVGGWNSAFAQAQQNRVAAPIDSRSMMALRGSVDPHVATQYDVGRMNPDAAINGITMYFAPTAEQKAELDALVQAQQTPGSPEYHQWLTPSQYASLFGMSSADVAQVQSWLQSQGFTVERVSNSRTSITFSGSAGQVETAFGTEMHQYAIEGVRHFANATNVSVPSALAGVVQSVRNLNDFRPLPQVRYHTGVTAGATPAFTDAQTGDHFLTPDDVATIYDITPAYNSGDTGSGQTIAVLGQSQIAVTDIENFQKAAGLTVQDPTITLVPGTGTSAVSAGDEAESDLDLEYSGAIGRGATIDFVYVGNNSNFSVYDAMQYAVDNRIGTILSLSYGTCELALGQSDYTTLDAIVEQGASQGQSLMAASGDDGSTSCWATPGMSLTQQETPAVNYPASSAFATGVGGTEFPAADAAAGNTTYWKTASGSDVISSARSYIPEMVWNDDSAAIGAEFGAADALSSGGGGVSTFAVRPSWQTGVTGIKSGSFRLVPDVSLDASADVAGYLYCTSDTSAWSTGQKASCTSGFRDASTQDLTIGGGTSFSTPIFAGMVSILNQKTNSTGQGVVAAALYPLAANAATYATAFHDITNGTNECTAGSKYCSTAGASEYSATVGYDEASGLGSVDFNNLLSVWSGATTPPLDESTTTVTPATTTPASGANDVITIAVAPSSSSVTGTPTGTLSVSVDGTVVNASLALASGSATYTFSSTVAGGHTIEAVYSGDATFAASTGKATVTVPGKATPAFTLAATNVAVAAGSTGTSTVTVTPANSYSGMVAFTATSGNSSLTTNGCYAINNATVTAGLAATATLTVYTSSSACAAAGVHSFLRAGGTGQAATSGAAPLGRTIPLSAAALAGVLLFGFRKMRAGARTLLGCLALMVVLGLAVGCGSSSGTKTTSNNVAAGSYTVTVAGTDTTTATITASTTLTVTVN
jgi:subtilase family serine protease